MKKKSPAKQIRNSEASLPRLAFSLKEAADILGVSYITAYRLNQRGLLKSNGALRTKIIPLAEIHRFLAITK